MNNKWLILINPAIALLILSQAVTGLNYFFKVISLKTFITLHMYGGYLLSVLVLIHLMINWFWVKNTFIKKKKAGKGAPASKASPGKPEKSGQKKI